MRFSLLAALGLLGLATATSDITFDAPLGPDGGFTIPEGTPDGVYSVVIGDDGLSHHTLVSDVVNDDGAPSALGTRAVGGASTLAKRAWRFDCGRRLSMDIGFTNNAVNGIADYCGNRRVTSAGGHTYAISGNVAAFVCVDRGGYVCTNYNIRWSLVSEVSWACGSFKEGWMEWFEGSDKWHSIGYHLVNDRKEFCGRAH